MGGWYSLTDPKDGNKGGPPGPVGALATFIFLTAGGAGVGSLGGPIGSVIGAVMGASAGIAIIIASVQGDNGDKE